MPLKSIILQLAATAFTACRAVSAFSRRPPYGGRAALPKADTAAMANVVVQNAYGMYSRIAFVPGVGQSWPSIFHGVGRGS
jgi:hypothetical protein